MRRVRKSEERGAADFGWLQSRHSFSFGSWFDPRHMGFRVLRVLNDDRVAPGAGFPTHSHRDMEIVSYVLEGALEHKDSTGTGSVIRPGDVQRMTAGRGIAHSEFNPSRTEPLHFLQIWLLPERPGLDPGYEERRFAAEDKRGRLRLVASPGGEEGSVVLHQDAKIFAGLFRRGESAALQLLPDRYGYVHVARGRVRVDGEELSSGDALEVSAEPRVRIEGADDEDAEVLVFDLP